MQTEQTINNDELFFEKSVREAREESVRYEASLVDAIIELDDKVKEYGTKLAELKEEIKEIGYNTGKMTFDGTHGRVELSEDEKLQIEVDDLVDYLKKNDKMNMFPYLVKVSITAVRSVLTSTVAETIGVLNKTGLKMKIKRR